VEDLVRVVRLVDGALAAGRTLPGRGAWLCRDSAVCVDSAQKRRAFDRALRGTVAAGAVERLKLQLGFPTGESDRNGPESPVA
jgi:predicted RNA-binding protein YlxR (DUF448 family)